MKHKECGRCSATGYIRVPNRDRPGEFIRLPCPVRKCEMGWIWYEEED